MNRRWLMAASVPLMIFGCGIAAAAAQNALPSGPAPAARKFELPPLDQLEATRERPLFSPTRRPQAVEAAAEPAAPPITESASLPFELTGIALGEEVRIAILHNKTTNEEVRLRQGDKIDEWMLESVANRFILLRGDGRRVRVWLFDDAKKPGVAVRSAHADGGEGAEAEESSTEPSADMPAEAPDSEASDDAEVDQDVRPDAAPASRAPPPAPKRAQRPSGQPKAAAAAGSAARSRGQRKPSSANDD